MANFTILVVDDEPDALEMMCVALRAEGYHCLQAEDAEQALAMLRSHLVHLIVADLMMPGLPGDKMAEQLRADARTARIPIILCSGKDTSPSERTMFDCCIPKPIDFDELLLAVRQLTQRRQTR